MRFIINLFHFFLKTASSDGIQDFIGVLPDICTIVRVFTNGPEDLGSIPGRVIPKTLKMVLDAALLNTQHYKVWINGTISDSTHMKL